MNPFIQLIQASPRKRLPCDQRLNHLEKEFAKSERPFQYIGDQEEGFRLALASNALAS